MSNNHGLHGSGNTPALSPCQGLAHWCASGPNAVSDAGEVHVGASVTIPVTDNDKPENEVVLCDATIRPGASGGTVTVNANGSITFDTGTDFDFLLQGQCEIVTIDYTIKDANGHTGKGIVTVTVCRPTIMWSDQDCVLILDGDGAFLPLE